MEKVGGTFLQKLRGGVDCFCDVFIDQIQILLITTDTDTQALRRTACLIKHCMHKFSNTNKCWIQFY